MHATQLCMWLFDLHAVVNLWKLTIITIAGVWGMTKEVMLCVTVDAEGDRQLIASDPQEICWGVERTLFTIQLSLCLLSFYMYIGDV